MEQDLTDNQIFSEIDFKLHPLKKGEYENCVFNNSDLSYTDLSEIKFIDCEFSGCNLSLVKLGGTAFRDIKFRDCKMLGLHFDTCNDFGLSFSFDECILDHSTFYKVKIRKASFKNSHLHECDLTECDLSGSVFENCDFTRSVFKNTILEKCDLRTSYSYSIDPEINKIKKAKFSFPEAGGLLDKYDIIIK